MYNCKINNIFKYPVGKGKLLYKTLRKCLIHTD